MLFSSITFLYLFLPAVLLVYAIVPKGWKNHVLLAASLLFYFCGEPIYVLLLVLSSISDWVHSMYIQQHRGEKGAKIALISSVAINLAMLGFFKYADFFIGTVNGLLGTNIPLTGVPLPIGISFFTFQTMSYTIDVYRGEAKAEKNFATFATFVCLFPQLVAGPIVRYTDISAALHDRSTGFDDLYAGIKRFVRGLAKKVLIANAMGEFCTLYRASAEPTAGFAWLYAIAYALQIFYDFSGYSDMAIGLGRMFGFHFPENFDAPYRSRSITEFWRRWHMTLGGWFRDYLYIPLGGNRVKKSRWFLNIAVVWAATGIWHGAAWNFVLWGLWFGVLLVLEKLWFGKQLQKAPKVLGHLYVLLAVLLSFVLFNAKDLGEAALDLGRMFGSAPLWSQETGKYLSRYLLLFAAAILPITSVLERIRDALNRKGWGRGLLSLLEPVWTAAVLFLVTAFLVDGSFNPFLYFRF